MPEACAGARTDCGSITAMLRARGPLGRHNCDLAASEAGPSPALASRTRFGGSRPRAGRTTAVLNAVHRAPSAKRKRWAAATLRAVAPLFYADDRVRECAVELHVDRAT